jgi:hypothetical protein
MDPVDRLRAAARRMTDPAEALAQGVAERVIDLLVQAVDLNVLLRGLDLNAVLERVDVNRLLRRVDVAELLDRVDINRLLEGADIEALLQRVDVNDLLRQVDVDMLVKQTDLGEIISRSTSGIAGQALDITRSQAVGLDQRVDRWVARLLRRRRIRPVAPVLLQARGGA